MENKKEETVYYGLVGRVRVEGKSYKEFTLNYLKELVNQYKNIDLKDRLKAYIQYFVDNFKYDKHERDRVIREYTTGSTETTDKNIEALFNFFYMGSGVCQQFSQALALIGNIDKDFIQNNIYVHYAECEIIKDIEAGHAVNIVNNNGQISIADISSMVHAKDGDYKQEVWSFGLVSQEKYIENINEEGMDIIPSNKDINEVYMVKYKVNTDLEAYHLILNLDRSELNKNDGQLFKAIAVPHHVKYIEQEKNPEI